MGLWDKARGEPSNSKAIRVGTDPAGAVEQSRKKTGQRNQGREQKMKEGADSPKGFTG